MNRMINLARADKEVERIIQVIANLEPLPILEEIEEEEDV